MANILTDGERDIINEQNRDAYAEWLYEWEAMSVEEREALMEYSRQEAERANREAFSALACPACGEYLNPPTPHSCGVLAAMEFSDEEGCPF